MKKGELVRVTRALYKMAEVEEKVNNVMVWDAIGENGIDIVRETHEAMSTLNSLIQEHLTHAQELREAVIHQDYDRIRDMERR